MKTFQDFYNEVMKLKEGSIKFPLKTWAHTGWIKIIDSRENQTWIEIYAQSEKIFHNNDFKQVALIGFISNLNIIHVYPRGYTHINSTWVELDLKTLDRQFIIIKIEDMIDDCYELFGISNGGWVKEIIERFLYLNVSQIPTLQVLEE